MTICCALLCAGQTVERDTAGRPTIATIDSVRYRLVDASEMRAILEDRAELDRQKRLASEQAALITDLKSLVEQWKAQFADSQKIVELQRVSLEAATALLKSAVPQKESWIIRLLKHPLTGPVVGFVVSYLADRVGPNN